MERTDLMDTSEWAHREMVRLLRALTPAQRIAMVVQKTDAGRQLHEQAIARLNEPPKNE